MSFDAHTKVDFTNALSHRWLTYGEDVLPLWVADMDFPIARPIVERLTTHLDNYPLFYNRISDDHSLQVCDHLIRRYDWHIQPHWIVWISGVVSGIYASVDGFVENNQSVIVPTPIYPPFLHAASRREHRIAKISLQNDNRWQIQLPDTKQSDRLLLLCNPHNPTGKVFSINELEAIADYACDNDLIVCSDEIFADLILDKQRHLPIASLHEKISKRSITLMSAGKAWNIAGMHTAYAIIPNDKLRARFQDVLKGISPEPSLLGVLATYTALRECDDWRLGLIEHLQENRRRLEQAIATMHGISWLPNQATFLAWLSCANNADEHWHSLLKSGLALSKGSDFGDSSYLRLNYGCTREHLEQAISILNKEFCAN